MVYEMVHGDKGFPWNATGKASGPPLLKPSNFEQIVEVSQVGLTDQGSTWMHTDPVTAPDVGTKVRTGTKAWSCCILFHCQFAFLLISLSSF